MDNRQIRKLSAIMFTDIVGYSKMMGSDERGTLEFLNIHNEIVREEVAGKAGKIIKTIGDAFLVDFDSAVNAVRAAVAIQGRMNEYNRDKKDTDKKYLRIGIHLGDVVISENDIFGDGVNIAARIQPIAEPGGICISHDVYNQVKNKIDISVTSLGPQELKNIADKMHIYAIVLSELEQGGKATLGRTGGIRRKAVAAGVLLVVGIVLVAAWMWHHTSHRAADSDRDWQLWLSDDFDDQAKFEQNWMNIRLDQYIKDGYLHTGLYSLHLKSVLPIQSIKIKIRFKPESGAVDHWNGVGLNFDASAFRALVFFFSIRENRIINNMGYSSSRGNTKTEFSFTTPFQLEDRPYDAEFTFDEDLLSMTTLTGERRETLLRDVSPKDTEMQIFLSEQSTPIDRIEIFTKKPQENMDLIQAADKYRMEGKYSLAINLYDDLIRMSKDDLAKCRYLYKKALALSAIGDTHAEMTVYQSIIDDYPDNIYTGYARFDLGLKHYSFKHGAEVNSLLKELVSKQPEHPESVRAYRYIVMNMAQNLADTSSAERFSRKTIERLNSTEVRRDLLSAMVYNRILYTDTRPATVAKTLAYLDEIEQTAGAGGAELGLSDLRMYVYDDARQLDEFLKKALSIIRDPAQKNLHDRIVWTVLSYADRKDGHGYDDLASNLIAEMKKHEIQSDDAFFLYARKAVYDGDTPAAIGYFKQFRKKQQTSSYAAAAKRFLDKHAPATPDVSYVKWTIDNSAAVIRYELSPQSVIQTKEKLLLHIGVNGWKDVRDYNMVISGNTWTYRVPLDTGIQELNFVFYDGKGKWDNNSGLDWAVKLKGNGNGGNGAGY